MQELYIHIGLHKTGTTFLQRSLFPHVPESNYLNNGDIVNALVKLTQTDILVYDKEEVFNMVAPYLNDKKNIISAEALSGNPFMQYLNRYDALLKMKETFPDAKIIVGIRSQQSMLVSIYKQYVLLGGTKNSELFFKTEKKTQKAEPVIYANSASVMNPKALLYSTYLQKIIQLFGKENVLIYVLEELKENYQSFVRRFDDFFKVIIPDIKIGAVNESLPPKIYPVLRPMNYAFKSPFFEKGLIKPPRSFIKILAKYLSKKDFDFSGCKEAYNNYKALYHEDNESLKIILPVSLHSYLEKY